MSQLFAAPHAASPIVAAAPGGAQAAGGVASVTLALLIVLAAIFAFAWLARRVRGFGNRCGGSLDVIAEMPLGPKERAVLLKVGTEQILIGVAPGRVSALHVLREPVEIPKSTATTPAATSFGALLKRSLGRSNACKVALLMLLIIPAVSHAAPGIPAFSIQTAAGGGQTYTLTLQVLALMTAITLLPAILLMMTAFTRIVIVLSILRQALGAGQTPPNQVLLGLALFLTFFVMSPVINRIDQTAYQPYSAGTIDAPTAFSRAEVPLKEFMLHQTRENDIATFVHIAGGQGYQTPLDVPLTVLVPAFVTSELKTSFIIGFLLFIPFVIIDLVVASVLMSMGMMMVSPVLISLPFKLMLFVLVDGWTLIMGTLASSFYH